MSEFPEIPFDAGKIVNELLNAVYRHYAVGYAANKHYFGYKEMEKIVSHKRSQECNDPQSISNVFYRELKEKLPELGISNLNHLCFPNYRFVIGLGITQNNQFEQRTGFEICVSLLCDYYTLYFVDDFYLLDFAHGPRLIAVPPFEIYSFKKRKSDLYLEMIKVVQDMVEARFPDKKFVSHSLLLTHPLTGVVPFNGDIYIGSPRTHFTLFELLFNPDISDKAQEID